MSWIIKFKVLVACYAQGVFIAGAQWDTDYGNVRVIPQK